MKRISLTGPVIKVLTVFGVILGFALLIYLMSGMPAPREQDRVGPSDGSFSIIKPREWESRITYSPPERGFLVQLSLRDPKSIEVNQWIEVAQFRAKPDAEKLAAEGYVAGQFGDQPAWVWSRMSRKLYIWQAVFESKGAWYSVTLALPYSIDVPTSPWWRYLQSFRARPAPTTHPGTATTDPAI